MGRGPLRVSRLPSGLNSTRLGGRSSELHCQRRFDGPSSTKWIVPEVSLVKAYMADTSGNLRFRRTARNFNPNVAMAGKITVVEVEKIVEKGAIDPDDVHLPGIFVHRIVLNATPEKRIEQRTTRKA